MRGEKVGWKVVTHAWQQGTGYTGLVMPIAVYQRGVITKRPHGWGPFCVFTSLSAARKFAMRAYHKEVILRCLYTPSRNKQVWTNGEINRRRHLRELPTGTALADTVKLVGEPIKIGGD